MIPLSTLALGLIDKHAVQLQDILCSTLLYTVTLWRYKSVPFGWVLWKLLIEGKRTHQKSHETAKPPTLVYPVFTLLCSMLHCSSPLPITLPPIPEILHLYSAAVWLTQPILLHRNLEEETPSLLLLCSLPSLEDYQDSFTMLLELARSSHSHCVPEFTQPVEKREERKRKGGREKPAEYQ